MNRAIEAENKEEMKAIGREGKEENASN